jgi:fluoride exporter
VRTRFSAPLLVVVIALGGAAGTLLRVLVSRLLPAAANGFPADTLIVNLVGSFVLGFVVVVAVERAAPSRYLRPLLGTGFCGGLTTFSTFVVEVDLLVRSGHLGTAAAYVAATMVACLAIARIGMVLARSAWTRRPAPMAPPPGSSSHDS